MWTARGFGAALCTRLSHCLYSIGLSRHGASQDTSADTRVPKSWGSSSDEFERASYGCQPLHHEIQLRAPGREGRLESQGPRVLRTLRLCASLGQRVVCTRLFEGCGVRAHCVFLPRFFVKQRWRRQQSRLQRQRQRAAPASGFRALPPCILAFLWVL